MVGVTPGKALGAIGVLCALREELGRLPERARARRSLHGIEILELELAGRRVLACASGVGKVHAARGAALLVSEGASAGLLVVGVCGGLRQALSPGALVHCTRAVQTDAARMGGGAPAADRALREAWRAVAPGAEGWFLTADRPVLSLWRRLRLARAFAGPCVADMETAAAACVAAAAGVPWAALRAVTDRATWGGGAAFRLHFPSQAGRCADTVPALLERLAGARATWSLDEDAPGPPESAGAGAGLPPPQRGR
jgi:adenosylhomocysteine nucleosidase